MTELKMKHKKLPNLWVWILGGMAAFFLLLHLLPAMGILTFIVQSGSMEPAIRTGSLCMVNQHVPYDRIEEGDIIAFRLADTMLVTHRVLAVTETGLETKGDANPASDGITVTAENYLGKTIGSIPGLGYMLDGLHRIQHRLMAFLTDADDKVNHLKIGSNQIAVVESFSPPGKIEAGMQVTKEVAVKNTGKAACYVRVLAVYSDSRMEEWCQADYQTDGHWIYREEDGHWYYDIPLAAGEETELLLTGVEISENIPESQRRSFDLLVYAESYQAAGYDSYQQAWSAYLSV